MAIWHVAPLPFTPAFRALGECDYVIIIIWDEICQKRDEICFNVQQAGTGPSRRHIQGSKIAKRLPSVKYSFTVVETRKFFENFFFEKITY